MKRFLFFALALITCITCRSQIIITIAGNGVSGYRGNNCPAIDAELDDPWGIAVDGNGSVYFAEPYSNRIRKVDTNGMITTFAGGGNGYLGIGGEMATEARLNFPWGVAVDNTGNVYLADTYNYCVRKVDTKGFITTIAGNGIQGMSGYGGAATAAELSNPLGVAVDNKGNVYIASGGCQILKVDTTGLINIIAGGNTYCGFSGDGGPATAAAMKEISGLVVDLSGNIYVGDANNNRVRKVDPSGMITTVAGTDTFGYKGDGWTATAAELWGPIYLALDGIGNLYISDFLNLRVRMVDTNGIINTVAGNGGQIFAGDCGLATKASISGPSGIGIDRKGNLYIADSWNNRIRKVSCCFEEQSDVIKAFPNPTSQTLKIQSTGIIKHIAIYNTLGQKVYESSGNNEEIQINIEYLPTGIYLLRVNDSWVQRFLKR